jgi:hypothetical protein
LFFIVVAALAGGFAAVCVVRIFVLNADAALAATLARDPGSVSADSVRSLVDTERTVAVIAQVVLWSKYAAFVAWVAVVSRKIGSLRQPRWYRQLPAWRLWLIIAVVLVATTVLWGAPAAATSLDGLVAADHRGMLLMGVRALAGIAEIWIAMSVWRRTETLLGQVQPAPPLIRNTYDWRPRG